MISCVPFGSRESSICERARSAYKGGRRKSEPAPRLDVVEHGRPTHAAPVRCNAGDGFDLGDEHQLRVRIAATTTFCQEQFASCAWFDRRLVCGHGLECLSLIIPLSNV